MSEANCPKCGSVKTSKDRGLPYSSFACGTNLIHPNDWQYGRDCLTAQLTALTARHEALVEECARLARDHEPLYGWGSRSIINDAWADGFRSACVQISDKIAALTADATAKGGAE